MKTACSVKKKKSVKKGNKPGAHLISRALIIQ